MKTDSILSQQASLLLAYTPFDAMGLQQVMALLGSAKERYFAPKEILAQPSDGVLEYVYILKQGAVLAKHGVADGVEFEAGDMFLANAASMGRAVTSSYEAVEDCFCWQIPYVNIKGISQRSKPLADFLMGESMHLLELSRKAMQTSYSQAALAEYSHMRRLSEVAHKKPLSCLADESLLNVLQTMHERRIGSMVITNTQEEVEGIFTRKDILGKVTLPQLALSTPVGQVMTRPVHTLGVEDSFEDATMLMARFGVRHVPVVENGKLAGIISERDLFAMQRLSLKKVVSSASEANTVADLVQVAKDIRLFARNMVSQGIQAKTLTQMISSLNDALTERLIALKSQEHGLDMHKACWLSFGSEGRAEQTIATDQDNGLVFVADGGQEVDTLEVQRQKWLAFAHEVNHALDACGYPLCKGNIMASSPECCLSLAEWRARFDRWIERGSPEDLLAANIYFDMRPLAGDKSLAETLLAHIGAKAKGNTRFLKMLSVDVLRRKVPLNWRGGLDGESLEGLKGIEAIDLKTRGTAIFVDFARLQALAYGINEVNTRKRLLAVAKARAIPDNYSHAWVTAFEYLQMLRLRVQMFDQNKEEGDALARAEAGAIAGYPNHISIEALNTIDRKLLKESFRMARKLQQRLELDYPN